MKLLPLLIVLLPGCAQVAASLPSVQHCSDVTYTRHGVAIEVTASCTAPIGGGLPIQP